MGVPELGWVLAAHAHGKGLATEAAAAALHWADEHLSHSRTVCMIAPENTASIRVAEKCGYGEAAANRVSDNPVILYSRHLHGMTTDAASESKGA